jgi:predicted MFS family arabinose efflux permease
MERGRAHWDSDRNPRAKWITSPLGGLSTVWCHRTLRAMGIAGGAFVVVQVCLSTYTVLFFVEDGKIGLVQAGLVLMVSQIGGVAGRVFWGWIADIMHDCFATLAVLAGVMTLCALACVAITPAWPMAASYALFFVLGSTASGWNGAFLAEVARLAPRNEVSSATGGSLFLVNVGRLVGPVLFVAGYQATGSYASAFALLAVPSLLGLVLLLAARTAESARG